MLVLENCDIEWDLVSTSYNLKRPIQNGSKTQTLLNVENGEKSTFIWVKTYEASLPNQIRSFKTLTLFQIESGT